MSGGQSDSHGNGPQPGTLHRELGFWQTASLSVGVMAPTLAMSVTGAAAAALLGRAATLAFVLAAAGVGLVAYGFLRLAAQFSHAGSVYAFVGHTLGPRAGFVAGWALLGTYLVFPPVSITGVAIFGRAFLDSSGIAPGIDWFPVAVVGWAVIWLLAARGVRPTTRGLLAFEGVSVALVLLLAAVIWVRLAGGHAPGGQVLTADVLRLPAGTSGSTLALAATSGFLAFAGFESAASLGEESFAPTRAIPRAIVAAVAFGAVCYVLVMAAQSLGFGTDAAGVAAFAGSETPLDDLGRTYVGRWLAVALDLGATLSALGAGLGGVTVASRMLFAFARDGLAWAPLNRRLRSVEAGSGAPRQALALEMIIGIALLAAFRLAGTAPLRVFFYLATPGVLSLLAMYLLTNVAAARHLLARSPLEVVLPALGCVIAGYVLYRNVWPIPDPPFEVFPYLVAGWLVIGVVLAAAAPSLAARVARGLALDRAPVRADQPAGPG